MKKYKEETYATIVDYELLTVRRFYTLKQRERLLGLLQTANWVSQGDANALKAVLFSEELQEYDTKEECGNALLFLNNLPDRDLKKFIVTKRNDTFTQMEKIFPYITREEWLADISRSNSYYCVLDRALMRYVTGDTTAALKMLKPLAQGNDTLSLKLVIGMMLLSNMDKQVGAYMHRFAVVKEKLYFDKAPVKCLEQLKQLEEGGLYTRVELKDIFYFDKNEPGGIKMGFAEDCYD